MPIPSSNVNPSKIRGDSLGRSNQRSSRSGSDNNDKKTTTTIFSGLWDLSAAVIPQWTKSTLRATLGVTVALYILNQKHCLPRPLSGIVSKVLFWPTLPITVGKRLGKWYTPIDETVIIGGAPFGFVNIPETLYNEYGVRGVVNLCEEYPGPVHQYDRLGIDHLWLPTTDHFEPTVDDLVDAVSFIRKHQAMGSKVYVHCRAGHGRSAAVVFAWMLYKDPIVDPFELNMELRKLRDIRKTLWKQPNLKEFHSRIKRTGLLRPPTTMPTQSKTYNYYRQNEDFSEEEDDDNGERGDS